MPRDNNKDNASRGRRDRPFGGKGRSGKPRGPEKKFTKRGFGPRTFEGEGDKPGFRKDREDRPFRRRDGDEAPRRFDRDERGRRFGRDDRPPRRDRDDRPPRRDRDDRPPRRDRDDARPAGRLADRKFRDRRDSGEFGSRDRSDEKPWKKREDRDDRRDERRGERGGDRPRFRDRNGRHDDERPKFGRPRWDRKRDSGDRKGDSGNRDDRRDNRRGGGEYRRRERPEGRTDWQEHPRSERGADRKSDRGDRFADRPRRDNEDDSRIFAKRPAFGGRGGYRERKRDFDKRDHDKRTPREEPKPKKAGERIAKVLARAGLASRRDAEEMVVQGRVTVNGRVINSPALDVTVNDVIAVDGEVLPPRERTRLFLYHKPRGLMTTHADPEGRPTVFDHLPEGLPRLISVGRLDFNTEGLLLLTNDGGLARVLELPDTGWLRRYRVRAHGEITQAQLDELKNGIEVDGVKYGPIDATLERDQGSNVWLVFAIREGKNREVRNVMAHLGLEVNRLIRVSYGPFQLGELAEGQVDEVRTRVLREQLGEKVIAQAGADFATPEQREAEEDGARQAKKPFRASGRNAIVSDRKGRRVLVQRSGSEEARARNEDEANGYGRPRRPKRGYHGKRDFRPRDE